MSCTSSRCVPLPHVPLADSWRWRCSCPCMKNSYIAARCCWCSLTAWQRRHALALHFPRSSSPSCMSIHHILRRARSSTTLHSAAALARARWLRVLRFTPPSFTSQTTRLYCALTPKRLMGVCHLCLRRLLILCALVWICCFCPSVNMQHRHVNKETRAWKKATYFKVQCSDLMERSVTGVLYTAHTANQLRAKAALRLIAHIFGSIAAPFG